MKAPTEREELLAEVLLVDESIRDSTLQTGLTILRQRKKRRQTIRCAALALLPLVLIVSFLVHRAVFPRVNDAGLIAVVAPTANPTVEGTAIEILSDEELLAFFPDRPVALVGPPGHQQLVLFDEVKK